MIDKILNPNTLYGDIFTNSTDEITKQYRSYCKQLHPDVCSDKRAEEAFTKLQAFYKQATTAIANNTWEATNYIVIPTTKGTVLSIKYLYHHRFEIGDYYVCNKVLIYVFDNNRKKFYDNFINQIRKLTYADKKMEDNFKKFFPKVLSQYQSKLGQYVVTLKKTEDVYPLRALIENGFSNRLPHTHLTWITSRLLNIACYLKWKGIVSNGIDIDNLFVSPHYHSILLLGGWWYTTEENKDMIGTTKNIFNIMPPKVKANKISSSITDIESIKSIGRQYQIDDTPQVIKDFYNKGSKEDSFKEMDEWDKVLIKGYGIRKFIKIDNNIIDKIYK